MLRFEFDEVIAYHPYRTYQPWDHGGYRLLHVDGVNLRDEAARAAVARAIYDLEVKLCDELNARGGKAFRDNHYGFTVRVDGRAYLAGNPVREESADTYYQIRISDGSVYLWLMPGPPDKGVAP